MIKSGFFERNLKILFPLPALVFIGVMMLFPIIYTLMLSFTNWNLTSGSPMRFVWLKSYSRVLAEPRFLQALGRTFVFTGMAVLAETFLGVFLALLLNRDFLAKGLVKLILLLPLVATPVAIGIVWNLFYDPTIGFANYILSLLGLPPAAWVSRRTLSYPLARSRRRVAMDTDDHPRGSRRSRESLARAL